MFIYIDNLLPLWLSCWAAVEAAAGESVVVASCKTLSDVARIKNGYWLLLYNYFSIIIIVAIWPITVKSETLH